MNHDRPGSTCSTDRGNRICGQPVAQPARVHAHFPCVVWLAGRSICTRELRPTPMSSAVTSSMWHRSRSRSRASIPHTTSYIRWVRRALSRRKTVRAHETSPRRPGEAGVRRIIYLGGLGDQSKALSAHLRSRHEVGAILRGSGVPVIEFRASIVLGPGSLSFEMIRTLTERLPVMITPRWVSVPAQPIAIQDLLRYLIAGLDHPIEGSRIYEIGGADQVSYGDLIREYARQRGLRRLIIRVPVLTPRLSSLWLGLVTPLYARVGRKLIESIRHPTIVRDDRRGGSSRSNRLGTASP